MSIDTVREVVEWLRNFRDEPVTITFHGGEPLLAGPGFYREALPLLSEGLANMKPSFAMQTNLWRMTPELAGILAKYRVPIGSSIDGPQVINDVQRGDGYFEKTMKGYRVALENGLEVRFICTFTSYSVQFREEIFRFFMENGFVLNCTRPCLRFGTTTPAGGPWNRKRTEISWSTCWTSPSDTWTRSR